VLLADDQQLVRGALAALLDLEPDIEVVAEVGRGDEVVDAARRLRPDVALLDVEMPGIDGLAATAALRAALPGCRVLVVTTFGRPGYLRRAMEAGASGFVVKDTPARQLADAVRRVHAGLRVVDPSLAAETLATGDSPLTPRETDVLRAAREGGTVADLAADLRLSEGTVRNHLSAAIGKTGARTRAEAVRLAEERGWLLA
jgi:two-component system response regulator DesR